MKVPLEKRVLVMSTNEAMQIAVAERLTESPYKLRNAKTFEELLASVDWTDILCVDEREVFEGAVDLVQERFAEYVPAVILSERAEREPFYFVKPAAVTYIKIPEGYSELRPTIDRLWQERMDKLGEPERYGILCRIAFEYSALYQSTVDAGQPHEALNVAAFHATELISRVTPKDPRMKINMDLDTTEGGTSVINPNQKDMRKSGVTA